MAIDGGIVILINESAAIGDASGPFARHLPPGHEGFYDRSTC